MQSPSFCYLKSFMIFKGIRRQSSDYLRMMADTTAVPDESAIRKSGNVIWQ